MYKATKLRPKTLQLLISIVEISRSSSSCPHISIVTKHYIMESNLLANSRQSMFCFFVFVRTAPANNFGFKGTSAHLALDISSRCIDLLPQDNTNSSATLFAVSILSVVFIPGLSF